jgi:hypothetical protein
MVYKFPERRSEIPLNSVQQSFKAAIVNDVHNSGEDPCSRRFPRCCTVLPQAATAVIRTPCDVHASVRLADRVADACAAHLLMRIACGNA